MSIENILSNAGAAISNGFKNSAATLGAMFQNAIGTAQATFSTLWDGGFVGIDVNNYTVIRDEIDTLMTKVEQVLTQFNANAEFETGVKGEAADAASEYVKAVNELLIAYVTTYRNFIKLADDAVAQMKAGDQQNAASIRTAADEIRSRAAEIRVD
jgi:ElaB/YqjD/DUF883 family membrane-anchored ribosome-binding protein